MRHLASRQGLSSRSAALLEAIRTAMVTDPSAGGLARLRHLAAGLRAEIERQAIRRIEGTAGETQPGVTKGFDASDQYFLVNRDDQADPVETLLEALIVSVAEVLDDILDRGSTLTGSGAVFARHPAGTDSGSSRRRCFSNLMRSPMVTSRGGFGPILAAARWALEPLRRRSAVRLSLRRWHAGHQLFIVLDQMHLTGVVGLDRASPRTTGHGPSGASTGSPSCSSPRRPRCGTPATSPRECTSAGSRPIW